MCFFCPKPKNILSDKGPYDRPGGRPHQVDVLAALKFCSFCRAGPGKEFRGLGCLMKRSGADLFNRYVYLWGS